MEETARKERNEKKLNELYPTFRAKIAAVLHDMEGHGYRPRIQDAWRSPEDQLRAFELGHSTLRYGFHNVTGSDGTPEALAVDVLDDDRPNAETREFLLLMAASAQAHGLETGIRWGLSNSNRVTINAAIAGRQWKAPIKVGWDPCHVQPAGFSVAQAKAGDRPFLKQ